jgi:hypothetical protein
MQKYAGQKVAKFFKISPVYWVSLSSLIGNVTQIMRALPQCIAVPCRQDMYKPSLQYAGVIFCASI